MPSSDSVNIPIRQREDLELHLDLFGQTPQWTVFPSLCCGLLQAVSASDAGQRGEGLAGFAIHPRLSLGRTMATTLEASEAGQVLALNFPVPRLDYGNLYRYFSIGPSGALFHLTLVFHEAINQRSASPELCDSRSGYSKNILSQMSPR